MTLPGPSKGRCPCEHPRCTLYGTVTKGRHVRGCPCDRCNGKRNRKSGLDRQREARKALGIPPQKFGDANEERWADAHFRTEVKSGKQVGPFVNLWVRCEAQIDANRPDHGDDGRPARVVAMPNDFGGDGLVVVRLSTWRDVIAPALANG